MDFVIGLPLDLNDVQNESLGEWDSIMVIKKKKTDVQEETVNAPL